MMSDQTKAKLENLIVYCISCKHLVCPSDCKILKEISKIEKSVFGEKNER